MLKKILIVFIMSIMLMPAMSYAETIDITDINSVISEPSSNGAQEVNTTETTIQSLSKKIQQKGAVIIMLIQEFGKQLVIAALIMSFIVMAIGALGNPQLTGKAVTSAIICVIMYIAIEYAPIIGDMALNFTKS